MMENGHEHRLAEKFSGLAVADSTSSASLLAAGGSSNNDHLFQVMKAVDAAEATIKQQDEENRRLRSELMKKMQELEKYKFGESMAERSSSVDQWDELDFHQSDPQISNREDKVNRVGNNSAGTLVLHQNFKPNREESALQSHLENGTWNVPPGSRARTTVENAGVSQSSSPSASIPRRYQIEGDYEARLNMPGHSLQMAEGDHSSSLWKQNIAHKIREHEDEILQLRKILSDYSVKEAQIRNEKCILEKRIAHMRLAFDQQQQDLVDAASKALSYRQDVMEENIRLSYELQAAQQERTMFVSSLLPLLTEYSLQPPVPDAQSIVSSVKVLFRHLQEKLNFTESKLKESQYQLAPWLQDGNTSNLATHSPARTMGMEMHKNGLELVPQPAFHHGIMPLNPNNPQAAEWDALSHRQSVIDGLGPKGFESAETGRYSALESRSTMVQDIPEQSAAARDARYEETPSKQVMFRDPVSNTEMEPEAERLHNDRDHYSAPTDDPNVPYPYLPPVLEEPSSSFSEAADDEPLPAIEDLQISGEAVPGRELLACGFSIKGTTSCNFEWVRHMEDGSVNYIEGAKQPNYLVTADDVDTYLAIEVQPLDDRKRKGELVKVFANEHRKITCDTEMQNHIERTLYSGHVSYRVSVATGYLDIWEPGILAIKREGYSIKCSGSTGVLVTEKFSPNINVAVPYGQPTEFIITDSSGAEHLLRADDNSTEISSWRDAIVLTLRLFIIRAGEKRKGRKRGIFFK